MAHFDISRAVWSPWELLYLIKAATRGLVATQGQQIAEQQQLFIGLLPVINKSGEAQMTEEMAKSVATQWALSGNGRLGEMLLNWGIVMLWTNFEVQVEQLLLAFFRQHPVGILAVEHAEVATRFFCINLAYIIAEKLGLPVYYDQFMPIPPIEVQLVHYCGT